MRSLGTTRTDGSAGDRQVRVGVIFGSIMIAALAMRLWPVRRAAR